MTDEATGTEVAERPAAVPALAHTPASEITADDVALPRLYIGQYMSEHVQEGRVEAGCLFTALGQDDADPQTVWSEGDDGLVVHLLDLRKGKSISEGGELVLFDYNDPDAPPDAWVTYNYAIALPEVDDQFPFKWLLTRTAKPAAQQMNTVLTKNAAKGPAYELAFEVTTVKRENDKGKYFVPRVRHVDAKEENVAIAAKQARLVAGGDAEAQADRPADEPAI